jgi:putative MATE family efflux protein
MSYINNKNMEIFQNAPVPKAVMTNIIPSVVSMIMVLIYNLADTFFIGQTGNAYMVAAISLATPAFLLFLAIGLLFGIGGTSLISRKLGEGDGEAARRASSFCFWTGFAVGIIGLAAILIWIDPVCRVVGATPDTAEYVKQYLMIVALGIPFLIVSNSFSNIIRAEGKANLSMMGMILGNLVNIILDPIMILGFGWNVAGAAVATVLGNMAAALFYIGHFVLKRSILSINIRDYRVGGGIAKGVVAIGIPASLNSILMSVSNITINNFMTGYGDMAVAGLGVAMKVNMIAVMLLIGVGAGIQPVLGFCFGAGNRKRFSAVLKFSLLFSVALSLVMTASVI